MNWNKKQIINIVADLAEENSFACRALFKVSEIVFTESVDTLAVSISSKPLLLINLNFLNEHVKSENDVKAVLLHEFLHVILMHTEKFKYNTPLLNIALDAIINSIIHRTYGEVYSNFFVRYYEWKDITSLLRPETDDDKFIPEWTPLHKQIYTGKFAADDLYELLKYLSSKGSINIKEHLIFIGNHDYDSSSISPENEKLLKGILGKMDGTGIWNKPGLRGSNDRLNNEKIKIEKLKSKRWRSSVYNILKKCMMEDASIKTDVRESIVMMPVLNNSDRRALISFSWSRIIPLIQNVYSVKHASETVNIYLDVSGSMNEEIDQLVALLNHFRKQIRTPLWVFSNEVEKASFKDGKLIYKSTGGTSISCVFDHIRANGFKKNLIVTDGYIESITDQMLLGINLQKLWTILSAKGNASEFNKHKIKYYQLNKI